MAYFTVRKMTSRVKTSNIQYYECFGWSCIGPISFYSQNIYAGRLRVIVEVTYRTFFSVALRPNADHGLFMLEVSRSHTTTHHIR